ncbi:MAG: phage tail tape measure C-terminal domain-containing protein, partial [Rhodanobacter sp.]
SDLRKQLQRRRAEQRTAVAQPGRADIDALRVAGALKVDANANAEKIMEAMHAANLIDGKKYYKAKQGFRDLDAQAQENALKAEIARLQQENLTGKEKIANARAIADVQAKLAKVRSDYATETTVASIQESAANKRVAQSYIDATEAAQIYIDTITRQNAREIAGIGRGTKFRESQAGLNTIEDKQTDAQQTLARDLRNKDITKKDYDAYLAIANATYTQEVAAYLERTRAINAAQADWSNGASEALWNYYDESQNVAKQTEALFTNAFKGMENALVEFTKTGKLDFKSLVDSMIADITRMAIQQSITGPIAKAMGGALGGGGIGGWIAGLLGKAEGGPVSAGTPYLVGERGPELFIPSSSGNIMPNGAGVNVTNVFHITGATDRRSQAQIAAAAGQGVQRAMARNN